MSTSIPSRSLTEFPLTAYKTTIGENTTQPRTAGTRTATALKKPCASSAVRISDREARRGRGLRKLRGEASKPMRSARLKLRVARVERAAASRIKEKNWRRRICWGLSDRFSLLAR